MHVLAIGDFGRRGAPGQRAVAAGMARVAARADTRFVVTTGDNFYDAGVAGPGDPHWRESWADVYPAAGLDVPWFVALGNHDHRGDIRAQIARSAVDRRWRLPAPCHQVTWTGSDGVRATFAFVDTTPFLADYRQGGVEEIPGIERLPTTGQLRWLDETLARCESDWKLVVGHHPIRSGSPFHGGSEELEERLLPLLQRHGVHAYLAGHEHDLQHLTAGDVQMVVTGSGAEARETGTEAATRFAAGVLGFVGLELGATQLGIRFHDARGDVTPRRRRRQGRAGAPGRAGRLTSLQACAAARRRVRRSPRCVAATSSVSPS